MDDASSDKLFAATTADGSLSIVGGITTGLVREIASRHKMSALAAVAVGRLTTGAALIGVGLKGSERVSLQIVADGPLASLVAEVSLVDHDTIGTRAYVQHPHVVLPRTSVGSVDVRHGVGSGRLQVTKSFEIGQPFVGIVQLRSGEIDDDIAAYFVQSQQIPGIVALGIVEHEDTILRAGGIIAQVMPSAHEDAFSELERRSKAMPDIAYLLKNNASPRDLIDALTGGAALRGGHEYDVRFQCRCNRDRVKLALIGLGKEDLQQLALERPITEATCEYCQHVFQLSSEEVLELAARLEQVTD